MTTSQSVALAVCSPHPSSNNSGLTRARSTNDLHPPTDQHQEAQTSQTRSRGLSLHRGQAQAQAQAQDAAVNVLTFTDVSSDLVRLPFASTSYLSSHGSDSHIVLRQSV